VSTGNAPTPGWQPSCHPATAPRSCCRPCEPRASNRQWHRLCAVKARSDRWRAIFRCMGRIGAA
jgi:hypothetical protein